MQHYFWLHKFKTMSFIESMRVLFDKQINKINKTNNYDSSIGVGAQLNALSTVFSTNCCLFESKVVSYSSIESLTANVWLMPPDNL